MSIFSVNCYAATDFKFTFKDKGFNYPDFNFYNCPFEPEYFLIVNIGYLTDIRLYFSDTPFFIESMPNSYEMYLDSQSGNGFLAYTCLNNNTQKWGGTTFSQNHIPIKNFLVRTKDVFYSSHDIYFNNNLIIESYGTTPLLKSVRSVKTLDSVLNETISILPITLTVVVGLVAIRKGISFTTKKIRNA